MKISEWDRTAKDKQVCIWGDGCTALGISLNCTMNMVYTVLVFFFLSQLEIFGEKEIRENHECNGSISSVKTLGILASSRGSFLSGSEPGSSQGEEGAGAEHSLEPLCSLSLKQRG